MGRAFRVCAAATFQQKSSRPPTSRHDSGGSTTPFQSKPRSRDRPSCACAPPDTRKDRRHYLGRSPPPGQLAQAFVIRSATPSLNGRPGELFRHWSTANGSRPAPPVEREEEGVHGPSVGRQNADEVPTACCSGLRGSPADVLSRFAAFDGSRSHGRRNQFRRGSRDSSRPVNCVMATARPPGPRRQRPSSRTDHREQKINGIRITASNHSRRELVRDRGRRLC